MCCKAVDSVSGPMLQGGCGCGGWWERWGCLPPDCEVSTRCEEMPSVVGQCQGIDSPRMLRSTQLYVSALLDDGRCRIPDGQCGYMNQVQDDVLCQHGMLTFVTTNLCPPAPEVV